jgi:SAM-dependent methyltransferase
MPLVSSCPGDMRLTTGRGRDDAGGVTGTRDHVLRNRSAWDQWAADYAGAGLRNWAAEASWGIWGVPEAQAGVLPPVLTGRDSVELGCGTGYVSAWLARRGARVIGLDNSAAQLATARGLQDRFGLRFPLIHASAEQAPFADASFDLAISEYGASIWCDPYAWIPEADLVELRPQPGAIASHPLATLEWARQWPCEEVWKARRPP